MIVRNKTSKDRDIKEWWRQTCPTEEDKLNGDWIHNFEFEIIGPDDTDKVTANFESLETYMNNNDDYQFIFKYDIEKGATVVIPTLFVAYGLYTIKIPKFMKFDELSFNLENDTDIILHYNVIEPTDSYRDRIYNLYTGNVDNEYIKKTISDDLDCLFYRVSQTSTDGKPQLQGIRPSMDQLMEFHYRHNILLWIKDTSVVKSLLEPKDTHFPKIIPKTKMTYKSFEETADSYLISFDSNICNEIPWFIQLWKN